MSCFRNPKTRIVNLHCGNLDFRFPLRVWCNGRWSNADLVAIHGTELILSLPEGCYGKGTDARLRTYDMAWHFSDHMVSSSGSAQLKNVGYKLEWWKILKIRIASWMIK